MGFNEIALMIFCVIFIFIVKKIFSMFKSRKNLLGKISTIELRGRKMLLILSLALVGFGIAYAYNVRDIFSIVYILIGVAYAIISTDKLYIAENGFCFDGKFVEYKKIKKWTQINSKFFEVVASSDLKDVTYTIPLDDTSSKEFAIIIKQNRAKPKKVKK